MKTKLRLLFILSGLLLADLACNLPSTVNNTPQAATLNALYNTSAAQTVSAVELTSTPIQTSTGVPSPTRPVRSSRLRRFLLLFPWCYAMRPTLSKM